MGRKRKNTFLYIVFFLYVALMLWLLFGRSNRYTEGIEYTQQLKNNMSLKPLFTIKNYFYVVTHHSPQSSLYRHCLINLIGNVALFIPAGVMMPVLWKRMRNFFLFLLMCILAIALVEGLQLVTLLGSCDIDDLILNLSGMILGYLLYLIFRK